ncbi:MAG: hypothetical protein HRT35_09635 [Algicola sp.]|nr:hypothetical protein [Algicola sp.]
MHHPDNTVIHYGYDVAGFPVTESYATQTLRTIKSVDHNGLLTEVDYGNGLTTKTTRYSSGAISDICTAIGSQGCGAASEAQHIVYSEYDSFGNLGKRDNRSQAVIDIFYYDVQDRLLTAGKKSFGGAEVLTHYRYDESGNMSAKSDFSLPDAGSYHYGVNDNDARLATANTIKAGPNAATYIDLKHNALNQNQSDRTMHYDYDSKGNIIRNTVKADDLPDAITRELTYNANNKPVTITANGKTSTFSYGSDGMRYRQVINDDKTIYYISGGSFEVEVDMATAAETTRSYIGDYAMTVIGGDNPGLKYLHRDRLGSIDTITKGNLTATVNNLHTQIIEDQRTFDAFGKARNDDGGTGVSQFLDITPRGFTNHEHLAESGLIHMNGRAYDPDLGRFLSVDPFISDPSDGQTLNPYSYVRNSPLSYIDPTGYLPEGGVYMALRSYLVEQCQGATHKGDRRECVEGAMNLTLGYSFSDGSTRLNHLPGTGSPTNSAGGAVEAGYAGMYDSLVSGVYNSSPFDLILMPFQSVPGLSIGKDLTTMTTLAYWTGQPTRTDRSGYTNEEKFIYDMGPAAVITLEALVFKKWRNPCGRSCFVAGTQVLTEDGYVDIEDIEVGDVVLAKNVTTGETEYKTVTHTWVVQDSAIYQVSIINDDNDIQTIDATDSHPFYVVGKGWVDTIDLVEGDTLVDKDEGFLTVESVIDQQRIETAYNFTVADYHTYYVTKRNVLVHNCGGLSRKLKNKMKRVYNQAAAGGNRGIVGSVKADDAMALGRAFVGAGYKIMSNGRGYVSADKLRTFRFPANKRGINRATGQPWSKTGKQVNFETKTARGEIPSSNVHLDVD